MVVVVLAAIASQLEKGKGSWLSFGSGWSPTINHQTPPSPPDSTGLFAAAEVLLTAVRAAPFVVIAVIAGALAIAFVAQVVLVVGPIVMATVGTLAVVLPAIVAAVAVIPWVCAALSGLFVVLGAIGSCCGCCMGLCPVGRFGW